MKIQIDSDEHWPVFCLSNDNYNSDFVIDLPDAFVEGFNQIQEQYNKMQKALGEMYDRCEQNRQEKFPSSQEELRASMLEIIKSIYGAPQSSQHSTNSI